MKRKEFIRNISLVGVGISLAPTRLFAISNQSQLTLPNAAVHIPHGNFADIVAERIEIPELELELSVQHFMRNGISASQQDVSVFTFYRYNEVLNVCFDKHGCHTSGEIAGLRTSTSQTCFAIANRQFEVELKAGSSSLSLRKV